MRWMWLPGVMLVAACAPVGGSPQAPFMLPPAADTSSGVAADAVAASSTGFLGEEDETSFTNGAAFSLTAVKSSEVDKAIATLQGAKVGSLPAKSIARSVGVTLRNPAHPTGKPLHAAKGMGGVSPAQAASDLRLKAKLGGLKVVTAARPRGYELASVSGSVDLRGVMPPVRDQGIRGTCTLFAAAGVADYVYRNVPAMTIKAASTQFMDWLYQTYVKPQVDPGEVWQDDGTSPDLLYLELNRQGNTGFPAVPGNMGYVAESDCPYSCCSLGVPSTDYLPAPLYQKLKAGQAIATQGIDMEPVANDVASIEAVLASRRPLSLALPVYLPDWAAPPAPAYHIAELTPTKLHTVGYHAVDLAGYQVDPRAPGGGWYILRNSWGTGWANAGYAEVSFQYVKDYGFSLYAPVGYTTQNSTVFTNLPFGKPKPAPKPVPTPKPFVSPTPQPSPGYYPEIAPFTPPFTSIRVTDGEIDVTTDRPVNMWRSYLDEATFKAHGSTVPMPPGWGPRWYEYSSFWPVLVFCDTPSYHCAPGRYYYRLGVRDMQGTITSTGIGSFIAR